MAYGPEPYDCRSPSSAVYCSLRYSPPPDTVIGLASPSWSWPLLLGVAFAFGVTASGWNGVFLAEVARLAPEGRVGEATGAVLMFGFAGLIVGPLVMAGVAAVANLGVAYGLLGLSTLVGTLALMGKHR